MDDTEKAWICWLRFSAVLMIDFATMSWCEGESFTGGLERRERFESAMALSGVQIFPFVT